jgi:hypothetical protein
MHQRKSGLLVSGEKVLRVKLGDGHLTDFGRDFYNDLWAQRRLAAYDGGGLPPIGGGGSFSNAYEKKVLEHVMGKTELVKPTTYLALATTVPTVTTTGLTIVEATYTGYARKEIKGTEYEAAVEGAPTKILNEKEEVFAACTGSTSTVIGWALCDKPETGKGGIIMWGSCTSTVISTTQTPASVAAKALELALA